MATTIDYSASERIGSSERLRPVEYLSIYNGFEVKLVRDHKWFMSMAIGRDVGEMVAAGAFENEGYSTAYAIRYRECEEGINAWVRGVGGLKLAERLVTNVVVYELLDLYDRPLNSRDPPMKKRLSRGFLVA